MADDDLHADRPCDHPDCMDLAVPGLLVQGKAVCMHHVEWAMGKAFQPLRDALDADS